ncbi:uncharacterized protein DS421_17g586080 [Arachis hypogaea]|nr:uncharacterized protein DS421_17g586080 [Arachis hypogaea]
MLQCDHYMRLDPYNTIVEGHLRDTSFYHVSQIGVVQCQLALVNALIERWRPETHTFHFPVGPTLSSYEALEAECLDQFGVAPRKAECRGSFIKLTWIRGLKDCFVLVDDIHIQRATHVDCKEIDSPLTLLLTWAWIRLPFLAPIPGNPRLFPIANRWCNWERTDRPYRYRSLAHFRRAFDELQEGQFVWEAYAIGRIDPDVIPPDIRQHSAI